MFDGMVTIQASSAADVRKALGIRTVVADESDSDDSDY